MIMIATRVRIRLYWWDPDPELEKVWLTLKWMGGGGDAVRPLVFCPLFKTYRVIGKQKQTKKLSFTTSQSTFILGP